MTDEPTHTDDHPVEVDGETILRLIALIDGAKSEIQENLLSQCGCTPNDELHEVEMKLNDVFSLLYTVAKNDTDLDNYITPGEEQVENFMSDIRNNQ